VSAQTRAATWEAVKPLGEADKAISASSTPRMRILLRSIPPTMVLPTREALAIGDWLRRQELFKALLDLTASPVLTWEMLVDGLSERFFGLRAVGDHEARSQVVAAYFALVAQARDPAASGRCRKSRLTYRSGCGSYAGWDATSRTRQSSAG
jgi:hypothetical protein